jgi:hypothetical protein
VTRPCRFRKALRLTAIYFIIVMVTLAQQAVKSPGLPHAIAKGASGDCNCCGCSPEQRANHTCCCSRENLSEHHEHKTSDCCKAKQKCTSTILSCGCPCCDNQQEFIVAKRFSEGLLVNHFYLTGFVTIERRNSGSPLQRFFDRSVEPPEPPP